jgi:uncharacterized protein
MQYRSFPRIPGVEISTLGFGAMRLPVVDRDQSKIDEEAATRLVRDAISGGVNYLDTAWVYHGGQSELFLGRALRGGWREKVQLATKCPVWDVEREGDWDRLLGAQLEKLQTDRIDFYLLHALNAERWEIVRRFGGLGAMERAKADGRIGHLGFSFHGPLSEFKTIADAYDWEFCQIQLNYLDEQFQAGLEGMRHAWARRIGVVVMEPLRGGALGRVPSEVAAIFGRSPRGWSPAEWALRWAWSHPEVVTVLSGMNAPEQLRENLAAAGAATRLDARDLARVEEAKAFYRARMVVPCTTCGYCDPCPSGVAIAETFTAYNAARMFDSKKRAAWSYRTFVLESEAGGDRCTECGECQPKCPQSIPIAEKLREAHAYLTSD